MVRRRTHHAPLLSFVRAGDAIRAYWLRCLQDERLRQRSGCCFFDSAAAVADQWLASFGGLLSVTIPLWRDCAAEGGGVSQVPFSSTSFCRPLWDPVQTQAWPLACWPRCLWVRRRAKMQAKITFWRVKTAKFFSPPAAGGQAPQTPPWGRNLPSYTYRQKRL